MLETKDVGSLVNYDELEFELSEAGLSAFHMSPEGKNKSANFRLRSKVSFPRRSAAV